MNEPTKACTKCGTNYPISHYYLRKKRKDSKAYPSPWCRPCHAKCQARWNKSNADSVKEYRRGWVKRDRTKNYDKYRQRELKKKYAQYGLTDDWYEKQMERQKGVCAICGDPELRLHNMTKTPLPLSVDHSHTTNKVRGLLCWSCNLNLHRVEDSGWLEKAITYLKGAV